MNITFTKRGFKGIFLLLQNVDLSSPRTPSVKAWPWNWAKVVAADHLVVTKCKCFVVTNFLSSLLLSWPPGSPLMESGKQEAAFG